MPEGVSNPSKKECRAWRPAELGVCLVALELRWPRMKGSSHQRLGGWRRVGRESLGYKGHPALRVPPYYLLTCCLADHAWDAWDT